MSDAVIFSDIMAHLVSRLTTALVGTDYASVRVSTIADESTAQVILRRDGGSRLSKTIMTSVISVNVYHLNYGDAENLSILVEALFDNLPDGNPIVNVNVQSYIQDVSDLKSQRRFMRFAIDHRGSNLEVPN
jgi:hypothetical protein